MSTKREKIVIIGAGLVGSLLSVYLARRGFDVEVYDKNPDILAIDRATDKSSINLTLCERGFRALDYVGVGDLIRSITIPVYGRMIHDTCGNLSYQGYGNDEQALYSIFRDDLNKTLLQFAQKNHNIAFYFDEKCLGIDVSNNTVTFKNLRSGVTSYRKADRIFGADGAFSAVRSQLQKIDRFNYSQQYMEYGYRELTIAKPGSEGWIAEKNVIHFWPRGHYMLMGFSNVDGSFTLSLHMPLEGETSFDAIQTKEKLLQFFEASFPDVIPQISALADEFFTHAINSMVTIRCFPWSFRDKIALIGDAAHAIVPYYGQGANAGFEDCIILDSCIEKHGGDWSKVFHEYERLRKANTDAIADLALQNFIELRDRVGDPRFLLRKEIERKVNRRYPDKYVALYSMIAFSSMPYLEALRIDQERRAFIDQIVNIEGIDAWNDGEFDVAIDEIMRKSALF